MHQLCLLVLPVILLASAKSFSSDKNSCSPDSFMHSGRANLITKIPQRYLGATKLHIPLTIFCQKEQSRSSSFWSSSSSGILDSNSYTSQDLKKLARFMPNHDENGKPYSQYEKCVRRLYLTNLFHPVKLGLENMKALHKALGNPMDLPETCVIHIAGTNGKGSVSFKIAKSLEATGKKVGLFVSPHVASFRERIQVNGKLITETEVEELLPQIYDICEKEKIPATFFEVTTALAFKFFSKRKVDFVVLETGLGGRLDATNVIIRPKLCIITSIGLEHTRILGDTIELIANEKAGIIKKDVPVLVGPNCPHDVIKQCANDKESSGYYTCDKVLERLELLNCSGEIDYDMENSNIARAALNLLISMIPTIPPISELELEKRLDSRPPCRFEELVTLTERGNYLKVILDVAHNPPAVESLVRKLKSKFRGESIRIVAGFSRDKDLSQCGKILLEYVTDPKKIHLVEALHPRAAKLEDMFHAEPMLKDSYFNENNRSITVQVKSAIALAERNNEIVVICGSVFLMAEAREAIGIDEARDSTYIAEVAGENFRNGQEKFFADQISKDF